MHPLLLATNIGWLANKGFIRCLNDPPPKLKAIKLHKLMYEIVGTRGILVLNGNILRGDLMSYCILTQAN